MSHYVKNITSAPPRMIQHSHNKKHSEGAGFPSMISHLKGTYDILTVRRISVSPASFDIDFAESKSQIPREEKMSVPRSVPAIKEEEHEGLQYWKVYFDFAYYLLVCPYRFVWNPSTKMYICHVNRLQKVFRKLLKF